MSVSPLFVKRTCQHMLDVLAGMSISEKQKEALSQIIRKVLEQALDPDEFPKLAEELTLSNLKDEFLEVPLATRILHTYATGQPDVLTELIRGVFHKYHPKGLVLSKELNLEEGRAKEYSKRVQEPINFDQLGKADPDRFFLAFRDEYRRRYCKSFKLMFRNGERALEFIQEILKEALEECSEKTVDDLIRRFDKKLESQNIYREMITKDIFEDLVGHEERDAPFDKNDPRIKALITAYEDGSWKNSANYHGCARSAA